MTSYSGAAARGREAAAVTNASFLLRKPVDVRLGWYKPPELVAAVPPFPEHWRPNPDPRSWRPRWEVIGECGHVLCIAHATTAYPTRWGGDGLLVVHPLSESARVSLMGKRKRCPGCPR